MDIRQPNQNEEAVILDIIPDTEESGFVASYPELPGCITCGETVAEVVANAEDAKVRCICITLFSQPTFRVFVKNTV